MNNKQNNQFSMFRTVVAVCAANVITIAKVKAFERLFNALKAKMAEILTVAQQRERVLTGITEDKQVQKRNLAKFASTIASVLTGYANTEDNLQLAAEVNYSESTLFGEKDEDLLITSTNIYNRAFDLLLVLDDYGINKALLDLYNDEITKFNDKKPAPATAKNTKEFLTEKLDGLFEEAINLLKLQMDTTGKIFSTIDADFYNLYKSSRKIINRGGKQTDNGLLKGTVKGKLTATATENTPLVDVLVQILELNLVVATNELGLFDFDDLPNGKYTLKASKQGYHDVILRDIEVKKGEEKVIELVMESWELRVGR